MANGSLVPRPRPGGGAASAATPPATPTNTPAAAADEATVGPNPKVVKGIRKDIAALEKAEGKRSWITLIGLIVVLVVALIATMSNMIMEKMKNEAILACEETHRLHPEAECAFVATASPKTMQAPQAVARMRPSVAQIPGPAAVPPQVAQRNVPAVDDDIPTFDVGAGDSKTDWPPGGVMKLCVHVPMIPGFEHGKKFYPSKTMQIEGGYPRPAEGGRETIFVPDGTCIVATNLKLRRTS